MNIIPVIDLKGGQVVQARGGQREHYRPLQSPLCHGSQPEAVIQGLRQFYRFDTLYVADLDAIEEHGSHADILTKLLRQFSECTFWLDAGHVTGSLIQQIQHPMLRPVIATENHGPGETRATLQQYANSVLSIDYKAGQILGDDAILDQPADWPADIIVMTLDRVGNAQGPDQQQLRQLKACSPDRRWFAAGGVRDDHDLQRLADLGIHGALLATALHQGTVKACRRH